MEFEYDVNKSISNQEKHGINFEEAQALWDAPHFVVSVAKVTGEEREIVVGRIEGEYWTAVTTWRGASMRIISVRRATGKERSAYDRYYNG
ncbi:BrnT family toxin [uncultured Adlercreutzia sp.]|uniref:BrnT family toxin n=1 Tax=uncultured Adlercreutzia sp. TaxID=875803 RepID=UPI0025FDADF2|nr:BrnT family toxin [uncultured Adlercreutzia sp.]